MTITPAPGTRPGHRRPAVPVIVVLIAVVVLGCALSGSVLNAVAAVTGTVPNAWRWTGLGGSDTTLSRLIGQHGSPAVAPPVTNGGSGTWWHPGPGLPWQLRLDGSLGPSAAASAPATVFVLDLGRTDPATIAAIHAAGGHAICRFSTGVWDAGSSTAADYPASVLGLSVDGYTDQRYVDLRQLGALRAPIDASLQQCRDKGFDGVDPVADDTVLDAGPTGIGYPVTYADQLAFDRMVAGDAHAAGLAIGLDSDIPVSDGFVRDLLPVLDYAVVSRCAAQQSCAPFARFTRAGRPVFDVEYVTDFQGASITAWQPALTALCPTARALRFSPVLLDSPDGGAGVARNCHS